MYDWMLNEISYVEMTPVVSNAVDAAKSYGHGRQRRCGEFCTENMDLFYLLYRAAATTMVLTCDCLHRRGLG